MYKMSVLTLDTGTDELFWPLILRGVGMGLIFVPLTGATVSGLPMKSIAQGTGWAGGSRLCGRGLGRLCAWHWHGEKLRGSPGMVFGRREFTRPGCVGRTGVVPSSGANRPARRQLNSCALRR